MSAKLVIVAILATALLGANVGLGAPILPTDANAMAMFRGTKTFAAGANSIDVDYAVFAPGHFNLGTVANSDSLYVYAYQLTAVAGKARYITVGLDGDETLGVIGHLGDGLAPNGGDVEWFVAVSGPPTSSRWNFSTTNLLTTNGPSAILYFTSASSPEWASATVQFTSVSAASMTLPSPMPEPATLGLLCLGGMSLLRRRP